MKRKTTKDILAESFLELINDKRISKITINDITSNCGMTQPTFYNYFKDKYDLIAWAYTSDTGKIMGRIGEQGYEWRDTLYDGARYFDKNRSLVVNALKHTGGRDAFMRQMERINIDLLCNEIRPCLKNVQRDQGRRIFSSGKANFTQEYFVYCKENCRSMAEKDPSFGHVGIFQTRPNCRIV